jgi:hypothetical protein
LVFWGKGQTGLQGRSLEAVAAVGLVAQTGLQEIRPYNHAHAAAHTQRIEGGPAELMGVLGATGLHVALARLELVAAARLELFTPAILDLSRQQTQAIFNCRLL